MAMVRGVLRVVRAVTNASVSPPRPERTYRKKTCSDTFAPIDRLRLEKKEKIARVRMGLYLSQQVETPSLVALGAKSVQKKSDEVKNCDYLFSINNSTAIRLRPRFSSLTITFPSHAPQ